MNQFKAITAKKANLVSKELYYLNFVACIALTIDLIPAWDEARVFANEIERLAPGLTKYEDKAGNLKDGPVDYPFVDRLYKKFDNDKEALKKELKIKSSKLDSLKFPNLTQNLL